LANRWQNGLFVAAVGKTEGEIMARLSRSPLATLTARRTLKVNQRPYWEQITQGRSLGYRKNSVRAGVWVARLKEGSFRREARLGLADDVVDADGVQVLDYAQAVKAADSWFMSALREATGQTPRRGSYTIKQCFEDYIKALEDRGAPDVHNARYDLQTYIPALGDIPVTKIMRPKIEAWRAEIANSRRRTNRKVDAEKKPKLAAPLTPEELRKRRSTANRIMRRLAAALNLAVEMHRTHANPLNWTLPALKNADTARVEFLSEEEQRSFVEACGAEPDFQRLVRSALYSGARYGELGRLRVGDFNERASTVFIGESKSGKARHVHLDPESCRFFKEICARRSSSEIMLLRDGGTAWQKDDQKKAMKRACAQAEIKKLGFHQLRHSAASRWLMLGVSLQVVAEQLGHADLRMVSKHYSHIADSHVRETFRALPGAGLDEAAKVKAGTVIELPKKAKRA
jgi:integrase